MGTDIGRRIAEDMCSSLSSCKLALDERVYSTQGVS